MGKKKTLTLLSSALALSMLLAGCSDSEEAGGSSGSSGSAEKEIKFMHSWPEGSSKKHFDVVNEIIAEYEGENEGVSIDLEVLSNEQYKDKLRVLSTSGDLPDVGLTWAAGFLEPYVGGNMFAPLDDVIEEELSDAFVPGTTEAY